MSKKQDRLKIIMQINDAAQLYKKYLVGKTFMYVFDNRYIEVMYKADNFRHLTGVDTDLSARDFYKLAQKKKLSTTQINFTSRHPYELCVRKVAHLKEIATLAYSESFMLEEIVTQTKSYKFGTTDLKFTLCLNKAYNHDGSEKGNCYIVESLRDEDCFSKSEDAFEVTHIFAKQNDTKRYSEHIFMASNSSMASLPQLVIDILNCWRDYETAPYQTRFDSSYRYLFDTNSGECRMWTNTYWGGWQENKTLREPPNLHYELDASFEDALQYNRLYFAQEYFLSGRLLKSMEIFTRYPCTEILCKLGMKKWVHELICGYTHIRKALNLRGKTKEACLLGGKPPLGYRNDEPDSGEKAAIGDFYFWEATT